MEETKIADPSGIGQMGLALITLIAGSLKIGFIEGTGYVLVWALVAGSLLQLIAGIVDIKKGNTLGASLFTIYGIYWLGVALSWYMVANNPNLVFDENVWTLVYFGLFVFSAFMIIGTRRTYFTLFFLLILITILFAFLTLSSATGNHIFGTIAGYTELIISAVAFYSANALIINGSRGEIVLPVGDLS